MRRPARVHKKGAAAPSHRPLARGGPATKIHALADGAGRLCALMLTAGQVHDIVGSHALLAAVPPMHRLITDKAYDANDLRAFLAGQGTEAVISPMPTRRSQPAFDCVPIERDLIERAFCRLKDWRAVAAHYDKTARNLLADVVTGWLR